MTQEDVVLKDLQDRKPAGLTSKEAIDRYGITRLAAVVYTLKKRGHLIDSTMVKVPTRYGSTHVAEYRLVGP